MHPYRNEGDAASDSAPTQSPKVMCEYMTKQYLVAQKKDPQDAPPRKEPTSTQKRPGSQRNQTAPKKKQCPIGKPTAGT